MSSARITTEHYTPAWSLEKTSDPTSGSEVDPGDQVTYTLTVTNTTDNAVVDNAVVTDDLSDVLQYASLDSVPAGATLSGDTLTWQVPELQPGETAELSYTVTVDDDAYDVAFSNVATPGDGGECTTCTTDHTTPPEAGRAVDPPAEHRWHEPRAARPRVRVPAGRSLGAESGTPAPACRGCSPDQPEAVVGTQATGSAAPLTRTPGSPGVAERRSRWVDPCPPPG